MAESDLAAGAGPAGPAGPCLGVRYNSVFQLKLNKRTKLFIFLFDIFDIFCLLGKFPGSFNSGDR